MSAPEDDPSGVSIAKTLLAVLILWAGAIAVCMVIVFFSSGCARYPVYPNNTLEQTLEQGEHHCPQLEVDLGTCHP